MIYRCEGCGATLEVSAEVPYPFVCQDADNDDADHVLTPVMPTPIWPEAPSGQPFVAFRSFLSTYHLARKHGMSDARFVELVNQLDEAVSEVDGQGFRFSPLKRDGAVSDLLGFEAEGGVWIKDETGNVAGSHKARHLFGIALHLDVVEALGLAPKIPAPLAIASCGNAALAAAVVAKAARRSLVVFIPTDADQVVVRRLKSLEAEVKVTPRRTGESGDPCFRRFQDAVRAGAIPFCCQGPANGLTLEGGQTLAYEAIAALPEGVVLDHMILQVGGGALASSVSRGFQAMVNAGRIKKRPVLHTVQTTGAAPLRRAWLRAQARAAVSHRDEALAFAATHRAAFMWPWESTPKSIAHGILDDETYDWFQIVRATLETGGRSVVVDEAELTEARRIAQEVSGVNATATGTAGLAGLAQLRREGVIAPGEQVLIAYTGVER